MSEYLLGIIGTVLFSAILMAILPNGKTSSMIKSVARLACLVVVLSPLVGFFKEGEVFGDNFLKTGIRTDKNFIEYCSKISIENAENALEQHLKERYGREFEVTFLWEERKMDEGVYEVERIKIMKAILLPTTGELSQKEGKEIQSYLLENFNFPSEVLKNDGG